MATETLNNPFADFGSIVSGQRFVGRKKALETITQRVLGDNYGNLAIIGLPRIGKSSLAWQGIMLKENELKAKKCIPIFFQCGSYKDARSFFSLLIMKLHDEMKMSFSDEKYFKYADSLVMELATLDDDTFELSIYRFFQIVKRFGYKIIYILDEFDSVRKIFDVAEFQLLRELSYNPDTKLCLVTCSRKTIKEIEAKDGAISDFSGTFMDLRLGMFDDDDIRLYWNRVASYNFTSSYKDKVEYYVGRHPFLLDLFNDYCYRTNTYNLEDNSNDIVAEIRLELWNQLKSIINTLEYEKIFDKAIQLILGPVYDVSTIDEEKLLKYEFIRIVDKESKLNVLGRIVGAQIEQGSYICFSDYFTQLIDQNFITNVEYWPLWTETEKKMRELIKIYIKETFHADWETEIVAKYENNIGFRDSNWLEQFNRLKDTREKSKRIFPSASSNLIDYTLTRDMYNVFMAIDWNWFGKVFTGQKKDWAEEFNFLADIRNPMAHNNREFISQDQILKATEYCKIIIRTISEWEAK